MENDVPLVVLKRRFLQARGGAHLCSLLRVLASLYLRKQICLLLNPADSKTGSPSGFVILKAFRKTLKYAEALVEPVRA
jgi:hypothetical protein